MRFFIAFLFLPFLALHGCASPYSLATKGDANALRAYLDKGGDPDKQTDGNTGLYAAATAGRADMVRDLIATGANVDKVSSRGTTPLIDAAFGGHSETVRVLLAAGAQVDLAINKGTTPLIAAIESGHTTIVVDLLKAGANVNAMGGSGGHWTPLLIASFVGDSETMNRLLQLGADDNARLHNGLTASVSTINEILISGLLPSGSLNLSFLRNWAFSGVSSQL
jgi:ankyrin repeat protein